MGRWTRRCALASMLALLTGLVMFGPAVSTSRAQVVAGSISGTVQDSTGGAVPDAEVKATAASTGQVISIKTDATGLFKIPFLRAGVYSVEVTKEGFKRSSFANVEVGVNEDHGLGVISLEVGQVTTLVEISAAPPLIQTTQSQISTTVTSSQLTVFPGLDLNTGLDRLVMQIPGVVGTRDNNRANTNGAAFSVNGLRGRANDQQIDGANNNDNSVTGPGLFVGNTDFVQEYQVTTNNFGPEYGRNAGSVVNVITKAGTNVWHGDLFVTEGNAKLNTLNSAQKSFEGLTKLPVRNDEFSGGAIGGHIIRDKVFLFSGFDDEIIPGGAVFSSGSLTPDAAGLSTLKTCYPNSTSLQALAAYGPFAVKGGNPVSQGTPSVQTISPTGLASCANVEFTGIKRTLNTAYHQFDVFERLDVQGAKDRVYGRFLYQHQLNNDASGTGSTGYIVNVPSIGQQWGVSWVRTFSSSMFNQLQLNFGRLGVQFGGNPFGSVPTTSNWDQALASITMPSGYLGFGPANNLPQGRIVNTYQLQDNFSYVRGRHQIKAGANLTYERSPNVFPANFNGSYAFASFGDFIANLPNSLSISLGSANLDFREHDSFWYVGDDYKLRSNLTLNLGLTYTYFGQPANLFNRLDTANETSSKPMYNPALPLSVRTFPVIPSPKTEFGPSAGFAYTPTWGGGAGKTVIRGGYRLAYDPPYYNIYLNIATASPQVLALTLTKTTTPVTTASVPLPANPTGNAIRALTAPYLTTGVSDPRSFNETNVTPNFAADHVQMWSLGAQRQLSQHAVLESRYVGNHGGGLFQSIDGNPLVSNLLTSFPNAVSGVTPCPAASAVVPTATGRVNCNLGVLRERTNTGVSDYNGWQTELRGTNLWDQLTLQASYTWSKTTDNTSEIFSSGAGGNTVAISQNPLDNLHGEHGLSGQNLPRSFTLSFGEDIPLLRSQHGLVGHILGGWGVAGNYLITSGQPYTPAEANLAASSGATWMDTSFNSGFFTYGSINTRPFAGSLSAPVSQVGIYAGDACKIKGAASAACGVAANTLISWTQLNGPGTLATTTPSAVRFIVNGATAESVYGTPFGNVGRNTVSDYQTNIANFAIYKYIKVTERVKMRFDTTFFNVFNHPNFSSVDAYLDDAGKLSENTGFGIPTLFAGGSANGQRRITFGLRVEF
ncbi:MAG: carboxypeptidase regulatory-like domain-containing protein [Terriglobia bacterium]